MPGKYPFLAHNALICVIAYAVTQSAAAEKTNSSINFEASVSHVYDSNVAVDEVDSNTRKGDTALRTKLAFGYKDNITERLKLSARFSYSAKEYNDLNEFDIRTHLLSSGFSYSLGAINTGVNIYYANTDLDRDDFLTLKRASPFASGHLSKNIFARAAYSHSYKDFSGRPERDANSDAINGDLYYFFDRTNHFVSAGYQYKSENAESSLFDYDSHKVKLRWTKRLIVFKQNTKLKLGLSYENRVYVDKTSAGSQAREDDRMRYSSLLEVPVFSNGFIDFSYEYSDYDSTLASQNYTQDLLQVGFRYEY